MMKAFQDIIDNVLFEVKVSLLSEVATEQRDTIEKSYREHLKTLYEDTYTEWATDNRDENMLIEFIKGCEIFFLQAPAQDKIDLLVFESDFDKIHSISTEALDMAVDYHRTGEKDSTYDVQKKRIISTLKKEAALAEGKPRLVDYIKYELEEAIQDLEFAAGSSMQMTQRLCDSIGGT